MAECAKPGTLLASCSTHSRPARLPLQGSGPRVGMSVRRVAGCSLRGFVTWDPDKMLRPWVRGPGQRKASGKTSLPAPAPAEELPALQDPPSPQPPVGSHKDPVDMGGGEGENRLAPLTSHPQSSGWR